MQILNNNITDNASEADMQEEVDRLLKENKFYKMVPHEVYGIPMRKEMKSYILREVHLPKVGRRSDHIIFIEKRSYVNIECKLAAIGEVIRQAKDHLKWADYSVICMPPDNYIATSYISEIIKEGLGLFYWFRGIGIFEFIYPKYNRKKDPEARKEAERIINNLIPTNLIPTNLFQS